MNFENNMRWLTNKKYIVPNLNKGKVLHSYIVRMLKVRLTRKSFNFFVTIVIIVIIIIILCHIVSLIYELLSASSPSMRVLPSWCPHSASVQVNQREEACVSWPVPRNSRQSKEGARRGGRASVNRRLQSPTHLSHEQTLGRQTKRRRTWCSAPAVFPSERTPTPTEEGSVGADRPRRPTTSPPAQRPDGVPTPSGQHRRRDDSLLNMMLCFVFMIP